MIYTHMLPHQQKMLDYLKGRSSCGLFCFLGSGKSLVALNYIEHTKAKRVLILADKNNILNNWPEQIYQHTNYDVVIRPDKEGLSNLPPRSETPLCVLVNYDIVARHKLDWCKQWDLVIMDESSEVKDQRTHKHQGVKLVCRSVPHKLMLNGKMMTERLEDVYGQVVLIGGEGKLPRTLTQFRQRYMRPHDQGYGWIPKRSAFTHVQRDIKDISYWLEDDGSVIMPKRHYHKIEVEMTAEQKRIDHELRTEFESHLKGSTIKTDFAAVCFIKRVQVAGGIFRTEEEWKPVRTGKLQALEQVIKDNPDSKIVVWHTYIPETLLLSRWLDTIGVTPTIIDSPTKGKELEAFAQAKSGVAIIRTSLCKGLNQLVGAGIAVFYSRPFSYARYAQAVGRTNRLTSEFEDTHVVDIVVKDSADESVYQMINQKKSVSTTLSALREMV